MNQTAGLFGALLIGVAIVAAYVWDRSSQSGSFAQAFPGIANWVNGTSPATSSVINSQTGSTSFPNGTGGTDTTDTPSLAVPQSVGYLLGSQAYQLAFSPNTGLQFQTSPNSGVSALPGPSSAVAAPTSLASGLFASIQPTYMSGGSLI